MLERQALQGPWARLVPLELSGPLERRAPELRVHPDRLARQEAPVRLAPLVRASLERQGLQGLRVPRELPEPLERRVLVSHCNKSS